MFYQICITLQMEQCPIITYEHGIFQMPYKFRNLLGLRVLGN